MKKNKWEYYTAYICADVGDLKEIMNRWYSDGWQYVDMFFMTVQYSKKKDDKGLYAYFTVRKKK